MLCIRVEKLKILVDNRLNSKTTLPLYAFVDCGHFARHKRSVTDSASVSHKSPPVFWLCVVPHSYTDTEHVAAACSMQRCSVDMCGHGLRDAANTAAVSNRTEHNCQCQRREEE